MIPEDLDGWKIEAMSLPGLGKRAIARRPGGVTYIFAQRADGSWRITKMRGGRIHDEQVYKNIPERVARTIKVLATNPHLQEATL